MSFKEWEKDWIVRQKERRQTLEAMLAAKSKDMRAAIARAALTLQTGDNS